MKKSAFTVCRSLLRCGSAAPVAAMVLVAGCRSVAAHDGHAAPRAQAVSHAPVSEAPRDGVWDVDVSDAVIQSGVKRFGINLGVESFYDSGQMLRDLTFNNPGFEGEVWQSILRCSGVSETTCTDPNQWTQWPENFLEGASLTVISGPAAGATGTVLESTKADPEEQDQGVMVRFAPMARPMNAGDFVLVKKAFPGGAQQGWWTTTYGGSSFSSESTDLAPESQGRQALAIHAGLAEQAASVSSYFDSMSGHSFVQLRGRYAIAFRAKWLRGATQMTVTVRRETTPAAEVLLSRVVQLTPGWKDYRLEFSAAETGKETGTVALEFDVHGADVLLDDAALTPESHEPGNPTAYRDAVVSTLRALRPGILRYQELSSPLDNLVAPAFARERAGSSERTSVQTAAPVGLGEFLTLCKTVGAEPWFTMPAAMTPDEMRGLMEYLAGPESSAWGARRAAMGQNAPWTAVFPKIHLELGNEEWNGPVFAGESMPDPAAYGQRVKDVFAAARGSQYFQPSKLDLVMGSFALMPDWTAREMRAASGYDSVAVAPYLFDELNDASTDEAVFGPMLAEPEMIDSRASGYMAGQARAAQAGGKALSVYEVNIGTASGSASQQAFDRAVPSMGAGLALIDHMLLMLRDLGVKNQSVWALSGYHNGFTNSVTHEQEMTPLFGVVVDMGGATNLRRPQYLAEQMVNEAMLPTMLRTAVMGGGPVWQQAMSANNHIALSDAHELQTFAFADGTERRLVLLNLSRTQTVPVRFSGKNAPTGDVTMSRLTAGAITDNNETRATVSPVSETMRGFAAGRTFALPPFSMTVLRWQSR